MKRALPEAIKNAYASIFTATVEADRVDDFLAALDEVLPHSAAEEGIIRFEVFRSKENPRAFTIVDLYRDKEAYDSHGRTPHIARLGVALAGCFAGEPGLGVYELYDGIPSKA
jgi:quinol monooxygenase YgiN